MLCLAQLQEGELHDVAGRRGDGLGLIDEVGRGLAAGRGGFLEPADRDRVHGLRGDEAREEEEEDAEAEWPHGVVGIGNGCRAAVRRPRTRTRTREIPGTRGLEKSTARIKKGERRSRNGQELSRKHGHKTARYDFTYLPTYLPT